jgi:hypothetical protein
VLGDLDALLDELARPTSIELRRNPATWRADARLGMPDAESGHVCIQAELDQNGIGTLDVAVEVRYGAGTWAVTFADERPARWVQIADRVALGLSADDRWVALRVADVDV